MGRRETDLDPDSGPLERFAHDLRELRRKAGNPSYRELARHAHYSPAALSMAANGRTLPSRAVTAAYVRACGGDAREWDLRWLELAAAVTGLAQGGEATASAGISGFVQPTLEAAVSEPSGAAPPAAGPAARAAGRIRRRTLWAAGLALPAAVLMAVLLLSGSPRTPAHSSDVGGPSPADQIPPGTDCGAHDGELAPPPPARAAAGSPSQPLHEIRFAAPADTREWGYWWGEKLVRETVTGEQPYQGGESLRIELPKGLVAVGNDHMKELTPGETVTVRLWYGGQGEAKICPWVYATDVQAPRWIRVEELELTTRSAPGWRTYQWVIPDIPLKGTGFQIDNTGTTGLIICIGSVSW